MLTKVWKLFSQFWATDRGLSIFLMIIVAVVFVVPPIGSRRVFGDVFFSLLLISGASAISPSKKVFIAVTGVSIVTLLLRWTDSLHAAPVPKVLDYLATTLSIVLFCIVVLAQVMKKGPITIHRIQGAIAAYLLIGLAWAHTYGLVEYVHPGSFTGAVTEAGRFSSWTYFSLVTLATLGYGDIAPVHPVARSLVTAEAITGQLYLAILVARLVSQELYYRQIAAERTTNSPNGHRVNKSHSHCEVASSEGLTDSYARSGKIHER